MKKIFSLLMLCLFGFLLGSCNDKATVLKYVDPETKEEIILNVEATSDKVVVIEALELLDKMNARKPTYLRIDAYKDIEFKSKITTNNTNVTTKSGNQKQNFQLTKNESNTYINGTVSSYSIEDFNGKVEDTTNIDAKYYFDEEYVYYDGTLTMTESYDNNNNYSVDYEYEKYMTIADFSKKKHKNIINYLFDNNSSSNKSIEEIVQSNNMTIDNVTKNSIKFKMETNIESEILPVISYDIPDDQRFTIYFTFDSNTGRLTQIYMDESKLLGEIYETVASSALSNRYDSVNVEVSEAKAIIDYKFSYDEVNVEILSPEYKPLYEQGSFDFYFNC